LKRSEAVSNVQRSAVEDDGSEEVEELQGLTPAEAVVELHELLETGTKRLSFGCLAMQRDCLSLMADIRSDRNVSFAHETKVLLHTSHQEVFGAALQSIELFVMLLLRTAAAKDDIERYRYLYDIGSVFERWLAGK
jgi:hypothetical protein